jgi:hypothetical protein
LNLADGPLFDSLLAAATALAGLVLVALAQAYTS